jgi:hypothetical protein
MRVVIAPLYAVKVWMVAHIFTHEATVAFDIGTENGGEFAFQTFFWHNFVPHIQVAKRMLQGRFIQSLIIINNHRWLCGQG